MPQPEIRAPQCGDCKSEGTRDRKNNVPAATYLIAQYKSGTTNIAKWVHKCEEHMGVELMNVRAQDLNGPLPPVFKLSMLVHEENRLGVFVVDYDGSTTPSTALTYSERCSCYTDQQREIAQTNKRTKILTPAENKLWYRHEQYRKNTTYDYRGSLMAELSRATGPEGEVYFYVEEPRYDSTYEQRVKFRDRLYASLDGHPAHLDIDDDVEDSDCAEIKFKIVAPPQMSVADFKTKADSLTRTFYELIDQLEDEEEDDEEEDPVECDICGGDHPTSDCEEEEEE